MRKSMCMSESNVQGLDGAMRRFFSTQHAHI